MVKKGKFNINDKGTPVIVPGSQTILNSSGNNEFVSTKSVRGTALVNSKRFSTYRGNRGDYRLSGGDISSYIPKDVRR